MTRLLPLVLSIALAGACAQSELGPSDAGGDAAGDDACVPDCDGRECGDDGCGGECAPGCDPPAECIEGACVACEETFSAPLSGVASGRLLWQPGHLYLAGTADGSGWVGDLDDCDGATIRDAVVTTGSATSSTGFSLAAIGDDLYLYGAVVTAGDPGNGMYARLARADLQVTWAVPLYGSDGVDEGWDIAASSAGNLWMVGVADTAAAPAPWAIKGDANGVACGFQPLAATGGSHAIAAAGADLYLAADNAGTAYLLRFADADCAVVGPCPCTPTWTSPAIAIGSATTQPLHMVLADGSAYLAGYATDTEAPDDAYAFVARVDLGTGAISGRYTFDPTADFDAFGALARGGNTIFAVGVQGWDGSASFTSGTAILHAIAHPLTGTDPPASWTQNPAAIDVFFGVATDDAGGVYAAGRVSSDSVVIRCTIGGACP